MGKSINIIRVNIRMIEAPAEVKIFSVVYGLYDIMLTLYLFSHLALGWDKRFVLARHMITFLLLGLSFFVIFIRVKLNRGLLKINYVYIWAIGYFISCLFSCIGSPAFYTSLKTTITMLLGLYLLIGINERYKDRDDLWVLLNSMVVSAFLSGFFILYESGFGLSYGRLGATENSNNIINILSHFCAVGAAINISFIQKAFCDKKKCSLILHIFYEGILAYTVLRTGSRTGMLIFILGVVWTVYYSTSARNRLLVVVMIILSGIIVLCRLIQTELFQVMYKRGLENIYKIFVLGKTVNDGSIEIRLEMICYGLKKWLDRPLFGWGSGSFEVLAGFGFYSHCDYIDLLFGIGLFGSILYYSLNFLGLLWLNKFKKTGDALVATAFTVGILMLLAGISSVTYMSLPTMVYMLITYKMGRIMKNKQRGIS